MTDRTHLLLEDAMTLSDDDRLDLAEKLLSSLPADEGWMEELAWRARRAHSEPHGGEEWEVVKRRIEARLASR